MSTDLWANIRGTALPAPVRRCGKRTQSGRPCQLDAMTCRYHSNKPRPRPLPEPETEIESRPKATASCDCPEHRSPVKTKTVWLPSRKGNLVPYTLEMK